jgi:hypothetical protein
MKVTFHLLLHVWPPCPKKICLSQNSSTRKIEYRVFFALPRILRGKIKKKKMVSSSAEVKNGEVYLHYQGQGQLYLVLFAAFTQSGKIQSADWLSWQTFRGFSQSLATNAGIVPYIRSRPFHCTLLPNPLFTNHHLTLRHHYHRRSPSTTLFVWITLV